MAAHPSLDAPPDPPASAQARGTHLRGAALLSQPALNKDTAFSAEERRELDLEAWLPAAVETIEQQVRRVWDGFLRQGDPLARFAYVSALRQRNLTLFHRFLQEHIEAVLPVVYTPTVGAVIETFSHTDLPAGQGLYITADHLPRLPELLRRAAPDGVDLLLVTDSEGILGIGDQGIGGIHICQGKLAVYTLCAGLNPERVLAVTLDVGTDRPSLLSDPLYPGSRRRRLRGEAYDAVLDGFVAAVEAVFPGAFLHWEDFGSPQARRVLDRYRQRLPSFNDDIQGTSAVAAAAVLAACRGQGVRLEEQRIVIFGAGTAGCGIAKRLVRLLQARGLSPEEARGRIWAIDRQGLLLEGQESIAPAARPYARPAGDGAGFETDAQGRIGLLEVVRRVRPTVLIGTSAVAGAFDRAVVEAMVAGMADRGAQRPMILPLSNPTALAEATPADLIDWSGGRVLVASGSPFPPVRHRGRERPIGQCNNCFVFPGLGFACVAVGATAVSEVMIDAALAALVEAIPASHDPELPLMPAIADCRTVGAAVAEAVAQAAVEEGLARLADGAEEARACLRQAHWSPSYRPLRPIMGTTTAAP
ncbi:MAG: oxaloacetate-decarboxylating malate dehydrogenase [Synechococcaceae cyanobacterium]